MNIGIDIDDTITNTYETLIPMVAVSYGINMDKLLKKTPSYKQLRGTLPDYNEFIRKNFDNKAKECVLENIDIFIDDNTMNCKAVKNKGITTLQMSTNFSKGSNDLRRVSDWQEIYNIIQEMYAV